MDDPKTREVRAWISKAGDDVEAARRLLAGNNPLTGIAAYHCQQAAEKALKAYLLFRDKGFGRTHNLEALLADCQDFDAEFASLEDAAVLLNPYAVLFRYPTTATELTVCEGEEAVQAAQQVLDLVVAQLR